VTVLHFATHGQFSSNIDQTFILAWDKPITLFDLKDLIEKRQQPLQKAINLLVLSACETAAGDRQAALGLAGGRYRQAPAVPLRRFGRWMMSRVACLWKPSMVNSQSLEALRLKHSAKPS
jgi:hypothetical protein